MSKHKIHSFNLTINWVHYQLWFWSSKCNQHLSISQLNSSWTLVALLNVGQVVLAGAVLRVGPIQGVLVTGQHCVKVWRRGNCWQVAHSTLTHWREGWETIETRCYRSSGFLATACNWVQLYCATTSICNDECLPTIALYFTCFLILSFLFFTSPLLFYT